MVVVVAVLVVVGAAVTLIVNVDGVLAVVVGVSTLLSVVVVALVVGVVVAVVVEAVVVETADTVEVGSGGYTTPTLLNDREGRGTGVDLTPRSLRSTQRCSWGPVLGWYTNPRQLLMVRHTSAQKLIGVDMSAKNVDGASMVSKATA